MKKIIPIFLGSCISVISYANTNSISVSPVNGDQQSKQDIYGNGLDQLPFIVTIHYDTYVGDDKNKEYFDNLQFQVGSIFTSDKAKDLELNKSCAYDETGAPFKSISSTVIGDKGVELFHSKDITDGKLFLHKNNEGLRWKYLEYSPYQNVSLCFTKKPNIFSKGVYSKDSNHYQSIQPKQYQSYLKSGKKCDHKGQRDCEVFQQYYMQVDARDYDDNFKVMTLNVKTSLTNNVDPLNSVFEYENFQVLKYNGNNHNVQIKDDKEGSPAKYGHKFTVTVDDDDKATILFVGIYKDAVNLTYSDGWDIKNGKVHLPWLITAHDKTDKEYHALISCGSDDKYICIHNAKLYKRSETRFHGPGGRWKSYQRAYMKPDASTYTDVKKVANWDYATVEYNSYDLKNGAPNGNQFSYLGTGHSNYRPSNYEYNFYIVDKYGNFTNKSQTPTEHV